jgi:hypothetical protein
LPIIHGIADNPARIWATIVRPETEHGKREAKSEIDQNPPHADPKRYKADPS